MEPELQCQHVHYGAVEGPGVPVGDYYDPCLDFAQGSSGAKDLGEAVDLVGLVSVKLAMFCMKNKSVCVVGRWGRIWAAEEQVEPVKIPSPIPDRETGRQCADVFRI